MIDWFVEQKLRFQRGTGHVSYILAVLNIYIAMKVTLSAQTLPAWIYGLIPVIYIMLMWSIGRYDEILDWSKRETAQSRAVNDPIILKLASDVEEIKEMLKK
jgi:hypothetical protein